MVISRFEAAAGVGFSSPASRMVSPEQSMGVGWLLWVVGAAFPWLLPTHSDLWTTFYSELLMAAMLLVPLGWFLWGSKRGWLVSRSVLVVVAVSCIPLGQAISGVLLFPGEAAFQFICVLAFAAAVSLGEQPQFCNPFKLVDGLFASLVLAALLSTGLALYQWLGLSGVGVLLPSIEIGGGRAVANVGQANNLSTLLVWGCVGLWWAVCRGAIGVWGATFAVAFLLLGLVLTGSRTGCVQAAFVAVMVLIWGGWQFSLRRILIVMFLGGWFIGLLSVLPVVCDFLFGTTGREMLSVGLRPKLWALAFESILQRPLVGFGWNQIVLAHVALSDQYAGLNTVMGHAHNFFLDLLLWSGVVLGGGLVLGVVGWGWSQLRKASTEVHLGCINCYRGFVDPCLA